MTQLDSCDSAMCHRSCRDDREPRYSNTFLTPTNNAVQDHHESHVRSPTIGRRERLPHLAERQRSRCIPFGQKRTIAHELKAFVDQMRTIVVPQSHNYGTTGIASVKGGTFREDRFDDEYMGPFEDERAYHDWRVSVVQAISTRHQPTMERLKIIRKELQDDHDIVFTHGDLNLGNVLIKVLGDGDVHIVAVLDWEMAGWRPAYWEYVKCMHCMGGCDTEWGEFVGMVLQKYEKEKALDDELQRLSGDAY